MNLASIAVIVAGPIAGLSISVGSAFIGMADDARQQQAFETRLGQMLANERNNDKRVQDLLAQMEAEGVIDADNINLNQAFRELYREGFYFAGSAADAWVSEQPEKQNSLSDEDVHRIAEEIVKIVQEEQGGKRE